MLQGIQSVFRGDDMVAPLFEEVLQPAPGHPLVFSYQYLQFIVSLDKSKNILSRLSSSVES